LDKADQRRLFPAHELAANRADCVAAQRVVQLPPVDFMLELLYEMLPYFEKSIGKKMHDFFLPSQEELEALRKRKHKEESGKVSEPGASATEGRSKPPQTLEEALRRQRDQQEKINEYLE
jgi:hypothetical protein